MSDISLETSEKNMCPVNYAVNLLSGKYKLRILHALIQESPKRFKVLEREIAGISPTMLTSQLRELERDGLVARAIFATVPPTVEYSMTKMGYSTLPMLTEIYKWGAAHQAAKLEKISD
jgi:DNA-binding HxlR family transcriptional regulator